MRKSQNSLLQLAALQRYHIEEIVDKWPLSVSRRARGPVPFLAKKILISSSLPPEDVYRQRNEKDSLEQLLRRINVIHLPDKFVANSEV